MNDLLDTQLPPGPRPTAALELHSRGPRHNRELRRDMAALHFESAEP